MEVRDGDDEGDDDGDCHVDGAFLKILSIGFQVLQVRHSGSRLSGFQALRLSGLAQG